MTSAFDGYEQSFIKDIYNDAEQAAAEPTAKRKRGGGGGGRKSRASAASNGLDPTNGAGAGDNTVIDEDENYANLPDFLYEIDKRARAAAEAGEMPDESAKFVDDPNSTLYDVRGKDLVEWARKIVEEDDKNIDVNSIDPTNLNTLSIITINNNIAVTETKTFLNCERIAALGTLLGFHYNPRKFAALVATFQNPNATIMVFPTGLITALGTSELTSAMRMIDHVISSISQLKNDFGNRMYPYLRAETVSLSNVVASLILFFRIDLNRLLELPFVRYEDNEFIGCILDIGKIAPRFASRRVKLLAFATGAIVITGTKSRSEVFQVYQAAFPYLVRCAEIDASGGVVRVSREEQLRTRPELRRALTLPAHSKEIIRLNVQQQIEMFEDMRVGHLDINGLRPELLGSALARTTVNANGDLVLLPTEQRNLMAVKKVARKRGNAESNVTNTLGQNVVAISTITHHSEKQVAIAEQRDELRKNLRANVIKKRGVEPTKKELDDAERKATAPKQTMLLPPEEAFVLIEENVED